MDIFILKALHLVAAFALFSSLGAILLGGSPGKSASALHGISLVLILLIGFTMLGKPTMGPYYWLAKLALWLFIGAAPVLAKRKLLPSAAVMGLCIAAAGTAAWLGISKPF